MPMCACVGGESISTGGCEALPWEAFAVEGHEADPTQACHQPAQVDCGRCYPQHRLCHCDDAGITWKRHAPYLDLFKQLMYSLQLYRMISVIIVRFARDFVSLYVLLGLFWIDYIQRVTSSVELWNFTDLCSQLMPSRFVEIFAKLSV